MTDRYLVRFCSETAALLMPDGTGKLFQNSILGTKKRTFSHTGTKYKFPVLCNVRQERRLNGKRDTTKMPG